MRNKGVTPETIPLLPKKASYSVEVRVTPVPRNRGIRVQQRWVFALMGFLALFNAYTMRVCLSITITEMTVPINSSHKIDNTCQIDRPKEESTKVNSTNQLYHWDESTQGIILSSFYWGYVLTHLPGGMLAERFGGKYSLGLGILSTALFTLFTPLAVEQGGSTALIVLRILMGMGEGTTFPALNAMLSQWTPPEERSKIGSMVFAGAQLGTVFTSTLSGLILHYSAMGWPAVFYVFGSIGVLWFIIWTLICYNNPSEHPFISEAEKKFLHERMSEHTHLKPPPVPWRHMFTSLPVFALIMAQIGHDWGFFTMVTDLPKYMSSVLAFPIKSNGYLSSLPYLCMWFCSIFSSWLADWLITAGHVSRTNIRKLGTTIASVGPGLFIVGASYVGCNEYTVVAMFTIGMTLMGTFYPGMKVNALDLCPNYSGSLMAVVNGIGALTGIITPIIVGELAPDSTNEQWRLVFWIVLGVFIVTNVIFVVYASGEVQYWNDPEFLMNLKKEREDNRREKEKEQYNQC
ncbi:putative inorganic phosphate cotransporter isoform X1 [Diachasmimorpha longicaudata]|uniref:putative inorganic phosphate cotransporter isoform X1 n=1 Tax=Diachasmimorpha longicaudata TaxID=58733 RepID=UPI0030B8BDBD